MRFGRDSFLRSPANILFAQVSQYGLKAQKLLAQGNGYKQHALKGPEALSPGQRIASHSNVFGRGLAHLYIVLVHLFHLSIVNILSDYKQHALKGQKLLAQGNALGIMAIGNAPCKGKSFKYCQEF